MPLFEYTCRACERTFEYLTRENREPSCPACGGRDIEKQLSVFAVSAPTSTRAFTSGPSPCGSCGDPRGPGSCSLN